MQVANTLAYYNMAIIIAVKSFILQAAAVRYCSVLVCIDPVLENFLRP
jgi:hypothetical protein